MPPLFDNIVHKQHRNMLKLQKQKTRRYQGFQALNSKEIRHNFKMLYILSPKLNCIRQRVEPNVNFNKFE